MKLNEICNKVAAKILGVSGTLVPEYYKGHLREKVFEVVGSMDGFIEIENFGHHNANIFRKVIE